MTRIAILYATISGSTERYAQMLGNMLDIGPSAVINIMTAGPEVVDSYDTIIVCSPTYGKGDLHYLWKSWIEADSFYQKQIALVVLGNSRSHKKTFAGALDHLIDDLNWENNDLIRIENQKALVIDMSQRRSLNHKSINKWANSLKSLISDASLANLVSIV